MHRETKSAQVFIRMMPTVKAAGELAAKDANRSFSSWVETLLIDRLKAEGYLTAEGALATKKAKKP